MFYIHMMADALKHCDNPDQTFEEFISQNTYLTDKGLLFQYYTDETINKKEAYQTYVIMKHLNVIKTYISKQYISEQRVSFSNPTSTKKNYLDQF